MSDHVLATRGESALGRFGRLVRAVFACTLFTAGYGALAGACYGIMFVGRDAPPMDANLLLAVSGIGALYGLAYGAATGMLGACLGGPVGWGAGGLLGCLIVGRAYFPMAPGFDLTPFVYLPAAIAAAFGATVGFVARLGLPVLPGMGWLIRTVYGSPLGGWLGWRRSCRPPRYPGGFPV